MQIEILIRSFLDGAYDERLLDIYADETKISYQRERYINAIKKFEQCYKPGDVELFSAPGRSEIGGNIRIIKTERFWQPQLILILLGS